MTAALKAVEEGQSISQAARDHGIPKWTSPAETIASPGVSLTQHFSEVTPLTGIPIDMSTPGTRASVHNNTQISNFEPSSSCHSFCKRGEPPRARLLTSATALEMLNEKERKKQEEAETKEKKRKEREEMKKRREEEQRKKSEERAKKAEERAKQKQKRKRERWNNRPREERERASNLQPSELKTHKALDL